MKLMNSVKATKDALDSIIYQDGFKEAYTTLYETAQAKAKDVNVFVRWSMWHALPVIERNDLLAQSCAPRQVNDAHIDTLLKKCLPVEKLAKLYANAKEA